MTDLPELQPREIQDELGRLYRKPRERHLFAIYGTGLEEAIRVDSAGAEFQVVPVRSELELRERLPPLEVADARLVFLVPWQGSLPLDLSSRFGHTRVSQIDTEARLLSLCGAREVDDAGRSSLATYLLRPKNPVKRYPVATGRVTREALWAAWLSVDWGLDVSGGIARDTLLAWAAHNGRGKQFANALDPATDPSAKGVREELVKYLHARLGPLGPVIWRTWEHGRGRELLEVSLFCESLWSSQDPAVSIWLIERLKPLLEPGELEQRAELIRALGESAPLAFRLLESRLAEGELESLVKAADAKVDDQYVRAALIGSDRLPCAWTGRLERLGRLLSMRAREPNFEAVAETAAALKALESHAWFQRSVHTRQVKRAEMAVRLLAWLAARPDQRIVVGDTDYADAVALGRWYAEEGGFVDWARRWARGSSEGVLGSGVQAVVALADKERADIDARFSSALENWVLAGRPSNQLVPIDQALKRFAVPFLEQSSDRRLLVLLMDGMAWSQAAQILGSLANRPNAWGPLTWHGLHRTGDGHYPVVLANLPTTTEVSRAALFASKEMPSGSALSTQKDEDRFRDNKLLQPFCAPSAPRLLLRADGHTGDGSASQEALTLISDAQRRIVGIVINAIDASLKGDTQEQHDWTADSIRSLPDILDAARDARRTVLLVSDHGHVPADRLRTLSSPGRGGARYRPWRGDADALQPGERRFSGPGVYAEKGADAVVLLATEDLRYGGAPHAGEHGGATLAEVVAPCVLIGWDEPGPEALLDPALKPRPPYVPDWWHFAVRPVVEAPRTPKPPSVGKKRAKGVLEGQLVLPQVSSPGDVPEPEVAVTAPSPVPAFAASLMLKARAPKAGQREEVVRAVALLLERGGALAAEVFAQHLNVLGFRVEGYVRGLQEVLNVDGYPVLRFDSRTRQVFLDRAKLEQQFEVEL